MSLPRFHIHLLQNSIRHMQQRVSLLLGATAEDRYLAFIDLYPNVTLRVPQLMIALTQERHYARITQQGKERTVSENAGQ